MKGEIVKLFKQIPFNFEGDEYQIRIMYDKNIVNTAAFLNNRPANGFRYQIQIPKHADTEKMLTECGIEELVGKCKADINEKRWVEIAKTF